MTKHRAACFRGWLMLGSRILGWSHLCWWCFSWGISRCFVYSLQATFIAAPFACVPNLPERDCVGAVAFASAFFWGGWSLQLSQHAGRRTVQVDTESASQEPTVLIAVDHNEAVLSQQDTVSKGHSEASQSFRNAVKVSEAVPHVKQMNGEASQGEGFFAGFWRFIVNSVRSSPVFYVLLGIYVAVVVVRAVRFAVCQAKWSSLKARSRLLADDDQLLVLQASELLKLSKTPKARLAEQVSIPLVVGLVDPVVFLPAAFTTWSSDEKWTAILHELMHVQRRDMVGQLLAALLRIIHWFHPASRYLERKLTEAREWATDQQVINLGFDASKYATCVLSVVARVQGERFPATADRLVIPMSADRLEERLLRMLKHTAGSSRVTSLLFHRVRCDGSCDCHHYPAIGNRSGSFCT